MLVSDIAVKTSRVLEELGSVVLGLNEELRILLATLLANGHVLLEGVPGVAKTTIARGLAYLMGLTEDTALTVNGVSYKGWSRIQFTPDLLPGDVTGSLVFNPATRDFEPRFGPVFTYVLLADEINRAIPRTQSALLQAMQERTVTIGGRTYPLEDRGRSKFFFVIATQNPVEQEGTYPLPEAQLDRFAARILVGYPKGLEVEKEIYRLHIYRVSEPIEELEPVVKPSWIVEAQDSIARSVEVPEEVLEVVVRLTSYTRPQVLESAAEYFELGASPRAGITLLRVAKAYAAMRGSEEVGVGDVEAVAFHVLNHRLIPSLEKMAEVAETVARYEIRYRVIAEGLKFAAEAAGLDIAMPFR
ncbi:MAG: ATPase [Thermoprotei archaeon]|nr:MAG: ATPase [Thermoprotei archaeon]